MQRWRSVLFVALTMLGSWGTGAALAWSGRLGWTYDAQLPITSSVAVAGSLVIAGDTGGNLHAVHAASGQAAWVYQGTNTIVGLPAVSGEMVVFVQADGTVTALRLANGSVLWKYAPPEDSYAADTVLDGVSIGDGKVFFVKGDGKMYAISAANGKFLWSYASGLELRSAPHFANGIVFLGEQKGIFSAINPRTGRRDWGGGAGGPINTPATSGENVYFSSWDGSVQSVRIRGVVPQWRVNVGTPITTPPSVSGDRVLVGVGDGSVFALNRANGATLWSFETQGGTVAATPIQAEGLVFVGSGQGTLFVLDAATGGERFSFPTGAGINGTPAFSGGVLFLGSADGKLYALR